MVSLKDIAEACGVSVATVSKALNNHSDVSQSRREQIKKKANELGYLPNMAAKALKTKSTHDIGILFVDAHNSGLTHPFFSEVLEGLKSEAEEKGYDLTFINTRSKMNRMSYLEHCLYRNVDGVVIACVDFLQPEAFVHLADERGVLAVHFHANGFFPASGDEFSADASRSSEKVQEAESLQFIFAFQDVEQPLAGKIGRGTGLVTHRRENGLALELASDNSHNLHSTDLK